MQISQTGLYMNWIETGRFLVIAGAIIASVGIVLLFADKLPIGRLPGDLRFGAGRLHVYIPVATCVLLSVVVTIIVNFFSKK